MVNLRRKLTAVFLALFAAVFLAAGVYFLRTEKVSYADTATVTTLTENDLDITNGVFEGLADGVDGKDGDYFTIDLTDMGVTQIGGNALSGCTRLVGITIPESVSVIKTNAFYGCENLTDVTILSSQLNMIDNLAFGNCVSLLTITLPEGLEAIGGDRVFYGCDRLVEIYNKSTSVSNEELAGAALNVYSEEGGSKLVEKGDYTYYVDGNTILLVDYKGEDEEILTLPEGYGDNNALYKVHYGTFRAHKGIKNIYLPHSAIELDKDAFAGANEKLVVIAASQMLYYYYKENPSTAANVNGDIGYEVELTLKYDNTPHIYSALNIGHNYGYKFSGLDIYEKDENGLMPAQTGYKTSTWYKEESFINKVDGTALDEMLRAHEATAGITLFARDTIQKPATSFTTDMLTYTGERLNPEAAIRNWSQYEDRAKCKVTVTEYNGVASATGEMRESGTYTITIDLSEEYGKWDTPITLTVDVAIDVAMLQWVSEVDNQFIPLDSPDSEVHLYIYEDIPYYRPLSSGTPTYKQVINSCLSYIEGNEHGYTVGLVPNDAMYTVEYLSSTREFTQAGTYTIQVKIKAKDGYYINCSEGSAAESRGVTKNSENKAENSITITKTIYVVMPSVNGIVLGGSTYSINASWTFGENAPGRPTTIFGDAEDLITFTLQRSDLSEGKYEYILKGEEKDFNYEDFGNVINSSIPAGDYILTIYLAVYDDYSGGVFVYNFAVLNAPYDFNELNDDLYEAKGDTVTTKLGDTNLSDYGTTSPYDTDIIPTGDNVWAQPVYLEKFYNAVRINSTTYSYNFAVTYRIISRVSDSVNYHPASWYDEGENAWLAPRAAGYYTINYSVSAPSYEAMTGSYSLIVYYEWDVADRLDRLGIRYEKAQDGKITLSSFTYNSDVLKYNNLYTDIFHSIYFEKSDDRDAIAEISAAKSALKIDEDYGYVNAGQYPVALAINDSYYVENKDAYLHRWAGEATNKYIIGKYVLVYYNIDKADTVIDLYAPGWNYGDLGAYFDETKILPNIQCSTNRDDNPDYTYTLVPRNGGDTIELENFYSASSGEYWLRVDVEEGDNYKAGYAQWIMRINPTEVSWSKAPEIANWKYGDYKKIFSEPSPTLDSLYFTISSSILNSAYYCTAGNDKHDEHDEKEHYRKITDILDARGELPVGHYYLVYHSDEQQNFAEFNYSVDFEVIKADNFWKKTPIIMDKTYGEIDKYFVPEFDVYFGLNSSVVIEYQEVVGNQTGSWGSLALRTAEGDDFVKVGKYNMRAYMPGTDDYNEMTFELTFEVAKAKNTWKEVPNVASWNEGKLKSISDVLTVSANHGTVYVTIMDSEGNIRVNNELAENISTSLLNKLTAGRYLMTAHVDGDERYDELTATIDFVISEDSVSQTVIMGLTIAFAAIAAALAVTAGILLIIRRRKDEQEFLEMIRAELRRK